MKITMNFSISDDDTGRYRNSADLRGFYRQFGLSGLEVMPLCEDSQGLIKPDMTVGVHACCLTDWMHLDQEFNQCPFVLIIHMIDNLLDGIGSRVFPGNLN